MILLTFLEKRKNLFRNKEGETLNSSFTNNKKFEFN